MLVFGGRGAGGLLLSDTWLYLLDEDTWQPVRNNEALDLPVPSPRVFSACCAVRVPSSKLSSISRSSSSDSSGGRDAAVSDVYLFGGTDGIDNCGDLWVFRGDPALLQWERLVAVGLPPCPRYGHQMVVLSEDESGQYGIRGRGQQLMVLGGCHVSPQGEVVGSNLSPGRCDHCYCTCRGCLTAATASYCLLLLHTLICNALCSMLSCPVLSCSGG
jgi:hypothetical protein